MAVKFKPLGHLDINSDPSALPFQADGKNEFSGAMTRCTNLHLDKPGLAITRAGSSKVNSTAIGETTPHLLVEMSGDRYAFAGTKIYLNESEIDRDRTSARWSAIRYSAYNVTDYSIFASNGTDRIRIPGTSTVTEAYDYAYAHSWEAGLISGDIYRFGSNRSNYQCWFDWEQPADSADEDEDDSVSPRRYLWNFEGARPYNWGIAAPASAPTLTTLRTGKAYAHEWEGLHHATEESYQFGTTRNDYQCTFDWEQNIAIADDESYFYLWFFEWQTSYGDQARVGVKYTYCRKSGVTLEAESNPSSAAYIEGETGFNITWGEPPDPQTTHIRVYRTLTDGATFYYAGEYPVQNLTAVCMTPDGALGTEVETDHDRPPLGAVVAGPTFNGYCFMLKDNLLYFSKPNQPEYWPADYYIEVGPPQEPLTAIQIHNGIPYVMSSEEFYMIQGTSAESFFPFPMKAKAGALANIGALSIGGQGIVHIDIDGMFQFKGANDDTKFADDRFSPIFTATTTGSIPGMNRTYASNCWLLTYNNRLWFGYPDTSETYPGNVIVFDLLTMRGRHYEYPFQMGHVTVDKTNNRILALDSTGYIRVLDDTSVTTDDGTGISWQLESKAFTDQLYKYFPRYAKYDVTIGAGATATGQILLNDASIQSHTLSTSRATVKRHIDGNNGDRLGIRITGTGSATIREVEVE